MSPTPRLSLDTVRVLLVDDDPRVRVTLARVLLRRGCQVVEADSVAAARGALDASQFDVVVTDLGLGDGTGFEVIAHARQLDPGTPVVILSGTIDELELDDDLMWRLSKPASSAQLVDAVATAGRARPALRLASGTHERAIVPMPPADAAALCEDARARLTVLSAVAALIRDGRSDAVDAIGVRPGLYEDQIERQVARLGAILAELAEMVARSEPQPA